MAATKHVVMLPGMLCTRRLYQHCIARLQHVDGRYHVHSPELWHHWTLHESVAQLLSELPANAPTFDVVGHSMGGYAAFELLRQAGPRLRKLVLCSTQARPDSPAQSAARRQQLEHTKREGVASLVTSAAPSLVHRSSDPQLVSALVDMAEEVGVAGFERQQAQVIARPDSRPSLGLIRCPVLVLSGAHDALIPLSSQRALVRDLHVQSTFSVVHSIVAEAGHTLLLEQPEQATALIVAFLSKE